MTPTVYGGVVALIGVFLMTRPLVWMLAFFIVTTLFGGASALELPALGGSSVQPNLLVLVLLGVRMVMSPPRQLLGFGDSVRQNGLLLAYCVYGGVTAYFLPRIFSDQISLVPMGAAYLGPRPLAVSSQNVTTAFYLLGTGFAALAGSLVAQDPRSPKILVPTFILVTWAHVLTGVADLGLTAVHQESLLKIFRNAHYQQLDQTISAFHRISGIMPEPSNYAAYGLVMLAIMGEMWMRGVAARATGLAALAMLVILLLTTSTTAYLGVAFYGFTLLFRILFMPGASETSKSAVVGILFLAFAGMAIGAMLFRPDFARKALDVLSYTTVAKGSTGSGSERALWAREGLQAFVFTHGLGVGVGSFRSSGLFAAAIGSVGLIGLLLLVGYLFQVVRPLSASTYRARVPAPLGAGVAASWAVLMSIVAASSTSATPDPGALCGVLAGLALVWRAPRASPRRERLGAPAGVVWSTGPGGAAPLAEREWFP